MPKRKEEKIIIPSAVPSIWHNIDIQRKQGVKLDKKELKFVENFVKKGNKIINSFETWVFDKKKKLVDHEKKLMDAKSYQLAHII